nr:CinA family protein [Spartinivicinus marinus]
MISTHSSIAEELIVSKNELCGNSPTEVCSLEYDNYLLAREVRDLLYKRKWLIATAESITGGNLAGTLSKVHWAGGALGGGIISYSTSVKNALLGVQNETNCGVINNQTALEMVYGLELQMSQANLFLEKNEKSEHFNAYVSLSGLSTHACNASPKVHIAIKLARHPAKVREFSLSDQYKNNSIERIYNIHKTIGITLRWLKLELLNFQDYSNFTEQHNSKQIQN